MHLKGKVVRSMCHAGEEKSGRERAKLLLANSEIVERRKGGKPKLIIWRKERRVLPKGRED